MTSTELVALVEALAWPAVALTAAIVLRKQLPSLLSRATKVGAFGLEVELQTAMEFVPTWSTPDLGDVRHATVAPNFSSYAPSLMEEFREDGSYDYAVIDLGEGKSWLTSRLYIFSIMLQRMRGLRCWVFLRPEEGARQVYLGLAFPDQVRWTLAQSFPWLEMAYARSYGDHNSYDVKSRIGALEPGSASELVKRFLSNIQRNDPPPLSEKGEWVPLEEGGPWERASWLKSSNIASILGVALRSATVVGDLNALSAKERAAVLCVGEEFVAVVGDGWTFKGLVDRRATLEKLGVVLSHVENTAA